MPKIELEIEDYQAPRWGLILLQALVAAMFVVFVVRFWLLQVHRGQDLAREAVANHLRTERIYAPRGFLQDRNGKLLAENRPAFALALIREDCPDINNALAQVSLWADIPLDRLLLKYQQDLGKVKRFEPIILLPDMPFELLAKVEARIRQWPGLSVITRTRRHYPYGPLLAHILGYVAEASEDELRKDKTLSLGDTVGKQGLELVLESTLRGKKGLDKIMVDARQRVLFRRMVQAPQSGTSITLSLDLDLQKVAAEALGEQAGSVVVLDPDTGKVLALVTQPSYDNNGFTSGFSTKEWEELRDDPREPMQNRTIQSAYPPGSVWKLLMAELLLKEGVNPRDRVVCTGETTLGNRVFRCWRKGGHGAVDLTTALIHSCDVYFYLMGERMGIDRIEAMATAAGFGKPTGINLPHERSGLVPSKEWKLRALGEPWQRGETLNVSIGQGFTQVTSVQIARYLAALLNGGRILELSLLLDAPVKEVGKLPSPQKDLDFILECMRLTVTEGTARVLNRPDAILGGKTGTAQVVKIGDVRLKAHEMEYRHRDHAWIATWARKDDKNYVVVVMVEHGGGGSSVAGPVARKVYDYLLGPVAGETPAPVPGGAVTPAPNGTATPGASTPPGAAQPPQTTQPGSSGQGRATPPPQPQPQSTPAPAPSPPPALENSGEPGRSLFQSKPKPGGRP